MTRWKPGKTYVYYVPKYDIFYLATYKPTGGPEHGWSPEPWTTYREYPDGFCKNDYVNFNPDILILIDNKRLTPVELQTVYVGEL